MELINICFSNGQYYIWDTLEWYLIRTKYKIMGTFDGAVEVSEEPDTERLPLKLSVVEVQFLVKNGIARTVEVPPKVKKAEPHFDEECYKELEDEDYDIQLQECRDEKRMEIAGLVDQIIEGKKEAGRGIVPDRETFIQDELSKITIPRVGWQEIYFQDPFIEYKEYIPVKCPAPETDLDLLKLRVFEDFNVKKNCFLTSALKYGGDFLAYPGDPSTHHAQYIIFCETSDRTSEFLHVLSEERVSIAVRKTYLIATLDKKTNEVLYKKKEDL